MMSADKAISEYVAFIKKRSELSDEQAEEIRATLGVLVKAIIEQVKLATIVATDSNNKNVTFLSIN